jgi:hypothetical protein
VTKTRANGKPYADLVWSAPAATTMLDVIAGAVQWKPDQPKTRKPRARDLACPHCGEVHPIARKDYCTGCGELRNETILYPEDQAATPAPGAGVTVGGKAPMSANLADLKRDGPAPPSVAPPMSANLADIAPPVWIDQAPDPEEPEPLPVFPRPALLRAKPQPNISPAGAD